VVRQVDYGSLPQLTSVRWPLAHRPSYANDKRQSNFTAQTALEEK